MHNARPALLLALQGVSREPRSEPGNSGAGTSAKRNQIRKFKGLQFGAVCCDFSYHIMPSEYEDQANTEGFISQPDPWVRKLNTAWRSNETRGNCVGVVDENVPTPRILCVHFALPLTRPT